MNTTEAVTGIVTLGVVLGARPVVDAVLLVHERVTRARTARRRDYLGTGRRHARRTPLAALFPGAPSEDAAGPAEKTPGPAGSNGTAPAGVLAARALDILGEDCPAAWREVAQARIADPAGSWAEIGTRVGMTAAAARCRLQRMVRAAGVSP